MSDSCWNVSDGLRKISYSLGKLSDGVGKVAYDLRKLSDGFRKVSDVLLGKCQMVSERCHMVS